MQASIQALDVHRTKSTFDLALAIEDSQFVTDLLLGRLDREIDILRLENAILRLTDHIDRVRAELIT